MQMKVTYRLSCGLSIVLNQIKPAALQPFGHPGRHSFSQLHNFPAYLIRKLIKITIMILGQY